METTRVILTDKHTLVRAGIRILLERIPGIKVIAETDTPLRALNLVKNLKPEIVFLDIAMCEVDGFNIASHIPKEFPGTNVIILSLHESDEYIAKAFNSGAKVFLSKNSKPHELKAGIESAKNNKIYMNQSVWEGINGDFTSCFNKNENNKKQKLS